MRMLAPILVILLVPVLSQPPASATPEIFLPDAPLGQETSTAPDLAGEWTNLTRPNAPTPRSGHTLTSLHPQSFSTNFLLFGGASSGATNETWLWNLSGWPGGWARIESAQGPRGRYSHTATLDSAVGKVVVFGGKLDSSLPSNETWMFDPLNLHWDSINATGPPSARFSHAMAYEPFTGRHVMFGGGPFLGWDNQTWLFDARNTTWTQAHPGSSPSPRGGHILAADPYRSRVVMFGGRNSATYLNDTWEYAVANNTWSRINTTEAPPPRLGQSVFVDRQRGLYLHGGEDRTGRVLNDTWVFNFGNNTWRRVSTCGPAPAVHGAAMAIYMHKRSVLFGGNTGGDATGDSYLFEQYACIWDHWADSSTPSARFGHTLTADSREGKQVLFGGSNSGGISSATWTFDPATRNWSDRRAMPNPGNRMNHASTYVSSIGRTMLMGGLAADNATWFYDARNNIWTSLAQPVFPSQRTHHQLVYHPPTDTVIMFGGAGCAQVCEETWVYEVGTNRWLNVTGPVRPAARYLFGMAHDQLLDRLVLYGGTTGVVTYGDTWLFNPHDRTWTESRPQRSPSPRYGHQMVFDPNSAGVLVFGGLDEFGQASDLWAYDHSASWWGDVTPARGPRNRLSAAASFDEASRTMYLFGGLTGNYWDGETWMFANGTPPDLPPKVSRTEPAADATEVPVFSSVIIEFDRAMNATATASSFRISPAVVGGSASVSDRTLTWDHAVPFEPEADYTVVVTSTAKSAAGVNMPEAHVFGFTTGKGGLPRPPFVIEASPAHGSTNVEADPVISVRFSQPMEWSQTIPSFSMKPEVLWDQESVTSDKMRFLNLESLAPGTEYAVTISTRATSVAGDPMVAPYFYRFSTAPAPRLLSVVPSTNAISVPVDQRLILEFSEPMLLSSVASAIVSSPPVLWNLSAEMGDRHFAATPTSHLEPGRAYTVTIDRTATSFAGFMMAEGTTLDFTTRSATGTSLRLDTIDLLWLGLGGLVVLVLLAIVFFVRRRAERPAESPERDMPIAGLRRPSHQVSETYKREATPPPAPPRAATYPTGPPSAATRAAAARRAAQVRTRKGA